MTALAWFGAGLVVLTALTLAIASWARLELGWFPAIALARAVLQLGVIAALLHGILTVPWTVVAFVALMLTTATLTSASRLRDLWRGRLAASVGVVAGSLTSLLLILALHLVPWEARYVVAVAGILVGNGMTAATLAGRNFLRQSRARRDEVEAWLALGATAPRAHDEVGREAVRESMLPSLDQTKATGLVTLPGAFG